MKYVINVYVGSCTWNDGSMGANSAGVSIGVLAGVASK